MFSSDAKSWRGVKVLPLDEQGNPIDDEPEKGGEADMTDEDWMKRGHEQAMAMREGGDAFLSSPDELGEQTGGYYNGDYPDSWHDKLNKQLDEDERYEASLEQDIKALYSAEQSRLEEKRGR